MKLRSIDLEVGYGLLIGCPDSYRVVIGCPDSYREVIGLLIGYLDAWRLLKSSRNLYLV